jgi:hypothetical protein
MADWTSRPGFCMRPLPHVARAVVAFVLLAALAIGTQLWVGAYQAEFEGDAAGHYASGVVIHDYLVSVFHGPSRSPMAFVAWFHSHYPIVGIGHWPPAYYLTEAAWMLCFSDSRTSLLMLVAATTAATALLIWFSVYRRFGPACAYIAAGTFVIMPLVQRSTADLMLDMPVALASFAATIAFARYVETGRSRWNILFAVLAAISILTKGNGVAMALVPPLAILFCRRFDMLRHFSFWVPVPVVAILTGPWYVLTYGQIAPGFRYHWGAEYARIALAANSEILLMSAGPVLIAVALVGLLAVIFDKAGRDALLSCNAALLAAIWIFQCVVPSAIQDRYLIPLVPPLIVLAVFGASLGTAWVQQRLAQATRPAIGHFGTIFAGRRLATIAVGLVFATVWLLAINMEPSPQASFDVPAQTVWAMRLAHNPVVLLAVPADQEGTAVAELALHDPNRPSSFAIRGSRLLGGGGYNNQDYAPLYDNEAEVSKAIDRYAIPFVVFSTRHAPGEWKHIRQIEALAAHSPDRWRLIRSWVDGDSETLLYQIVGNDDRQADTGALMRLSGPRALDNLREAL